jgi:hypothetical protein
MKSETFIKVLRKIIREEVQSVVREELSTLLETPESQKPMTEVKKPVMKNSLVDSIRPTKTQQSQKPMSFTNNNILNDILNETANGGEWRSMFEGTSQQAPNFSSMMGQYGGTPEPVVVESVDKMLANTRPAGDINAVKIDVVPDFSALMNKMKENGKI